jgi:hypothetical protein
VRLKAYASLLLFVFDKFLFLTQTHRNIEKVGEERGIVCSHRDA